MSERSDEVVFDASDAPPLPADCTRENSTNITIKKKQESKADVGLFHYASVIAMLAVDDSVVFVCMIQGSDINLLDVMCGALLGSMLIVIICRLLSSIACINNVLQQIPKWALIVGLGCWVVLSAFVRLEVF
mmetsp:Transcript_5316/g.10402  ORF Transcript_5316/g.10402 Transcript_5316/m.10402 type:complete len:132 (-) Transcript_5316:149-544(-)